MPRDRIEREILIEAPVDVVWGVITEPEQIKRWFTDAADIDVRPGGNGTLHWDAKATNDPATAHLRVEAVEPPHRFAFRWDFPEDAEPRPDNSLLVEFTLVAEGGSTRLRLVESGFALLDRPADVKARYIDDHNHGWDVHMASLREYAAQLPPGLGRAMTRTGGEDEELWAAVAEPSRRRVLDVLLARGEATSTALAAELPLTRQAVAKHLAVLDRAGLVEGRRQGREVRYVVRPDRLAAAVQAMTGVAAQWDRRLVTIKRIAEDLHRDA